MLASDKGRERFWAERSHQHGELVALDFPDGSQTSMRVTVVERPTRLVVHYFGSETAFQLKAVDQARTDLEVTVSNVPPKELLDVAAGWVSVLLNLKAVLNCGCDLRNHDAERSWQTGFVDN